MGWVATGLFHPDFSASSILKTHIPRNNVLLIGALCLVGGYIISYQLGAELLNFGAFIGFMGVNLAVFWFRSGSASSHKKLGSLASPGARVPDLPGHLERALRPVAKLFGALWLALGIAYGAWRTPGFREPIRFEAPAERSLPTE